MATSRTTVLHPVENLRSLATELEAALTLVRTDPAKRAVHKLRTTTRRMEAQLILLERLPGLPEDKSAAETLPRLLRTVRRSCGAVRDIDVQRDTLQQIFLKKPLPAGTVLDSASTESTAPTNRPSRKEERRAEELRSSARDLRKLLKHRRSVAAEALLHTLKRRGPQLVKELEALLESLADTAPTLSPAELQELTRTWYRTTVTAEFTPSDDQPSSTPSVVPPSTLSLPDMAALDRDQLHTLRKYAKLARYLAESGTTSAQPGGADSLQQLASRFHALQEQGGEWHDALTLKQLARHDLGKRNPLTTELGQQCDSSLQRFHEQLVAFKP